VYSGTPTQPGSLTSVTDDSRQLAPSNLVNPQSRRLR
jgi:hypothetical protein